MTTTWLLGIFLVSHGLLHLAIWLPRPQEETAPPAAFYPDHSMVLTALHARTTHRLAVGLATTVAMAYALAGFAVVTSSPLAVVMAAAAAVLGLALKALFFHPWLTIGVLIDLTVLASAVWAWPLSLA